MVVKMFLFIGCALPFSRFTTGVSYHKLRSHVKMFWYEFCREDQILTGARVFLAYACDTSHVSRVGWAAKNGLIWRLDIGHSHLHAFLP